MKLKMFFLGLALFLVGSFLFVRWQQIKASFVGEADVPMISGYVVNIKKASFYPIYQILGLTGLLTLFIGLLMSMLSWA